MQSDAHPGATNLRILVVDDHEPMRRMLGRSLEGAGYRCTLAADAQEARAELRAGTFALLVCDVNLPGQSGLDLTRHVLSDYPDIAALMVSGSDLADHTVTALEYGAYGYLLKPFTFTTLRIAVMNALRRRELEIQHRAHTDRLEQMVLERTASLEASRAETVRRLSRAMEYRDPETGEHVERMSHYCAMLAGSFGLDADLLEVASAMHDIGKIAVPDSILLKPCSLTPEERRTMEAHAQRGYELLCDSESAILRLAATVARTHHERYDGSGYPRGLAGEEIPLEGRIAAVADVFDALTSVRPYRDALPLDQALAMMRDDRGRHFDPIVLDAFMDRLDEVEAVRATTEVGTPGH